MKENIISEKEREIINLGTSIAAGCQPCTKYHVKKCKETGISENEIYEIINQTEQISTEAMKIMKLRAITNLNINNNKEVLFQLKCDNRRDILVGLAVSYTITNTDLFDFYIKRADNIGIRNMEISDIIETSKFINSKSKAHVDILSEKRGIENQINENEDCTPMCGC